ncbi:hypothetical protein PhCBS80983_g01469 [Powellomyces hirtus]|uniref:Orc1-like AAA ATPase domain-containing protein n=1 Tax=Powellomyces hirtus TaxID=109895 RepID=A0A507ECW9_9FUNG|nr:hypothetical protein PhCBS80983_g01469 [Powellomyces hirtus]
MASEPEPPMDERPSQASLFPGREDQLDDLSKLLADKDCAPSVLFLSGLPGTAKTLIIDHVLRGRNDRIAWLDCVERHNPRLLLESALTQLSGCRPEPLTDDNSGLWGTFQQCDSVSEFVGCLDEALPVPAPEDTRMTTVVFDHAEKLRDMGPFFLPAITRFAALTERTVTVILISNLTWLHFRSRVGSIEAFSVEFPQYTRAEILQIIARDCPADEEPGFYVSFAEILYDVFSNPCRDIKELRHMVTLLFPKYVEPVKNGKATREQTSKLFGHIQTHIKDALHTLYLREMSSSEWQTQNEPSSAASKANPRAGSGAVDLPYYTKFLVIAAFLASYNPARLDVRFFSKDRSDEVKRRKGGKGRSRGLVNEGGHMRQQLLGPKSFPVERMLAIFYSILPDEIEGTTDIQMQIASLMTLRILLRVTTPDRLDGMKCKCNASYEFVQQLGKSVRFDVSQYLHDFI